MKEKIALWYKIGLWTESMVMEAVDKGILSQADYEDIVSSSTN